MFEEQKNDIINENIHDKLTIQSGTHNKHKTKVWQIKSNFSNSEQLWKHFMDYNYVSVGFSDIDLNISLKKFNSPNELFERVKDNLNSNNIKKESKLIYNFVNNINIGDVIVFTSDKNIVYGVGVVESDYIPPKKSDIMFYANLIHSRKVKWIYTKEIEIDTNFSSKEDRLPDEEWIKIILKYWDRNTTDKLLNDFFISYRKEFNYDDKGAYNFYKEHSEEFNKNLNEIIQDMEHDFVDAERIFNQIILPKDTIFKEQIGNFYKYNQAKYKRTDKEMESSAVEYVKLMQLFRDVTDEKILTKALEDFEKKELNKGIGLSRLSASLMYLDTSKYSVINSKTRMYMDLIPKFRDYEFTLNNSISKYVEDNKNIREFTEYLIKNTNFSSYEDLDQFGYWLYEHNLFRRSLNYFRLRPSNEKRNKIYFGAPGTGKSFKLNEDKEILLSGYEDNYSRVTFHPDYSYANFVGTYKPVPLRDENGKIKESDDGSTPISYTYVPGPFMKLLAKAHDKKEEPYLLIIEEINRANVAAVFGDIFQLLDRKADFKSRYPIDLSEDAKNYLKDEIGKTDDQIYIPSNMFIWATMNSADQGVFPMDTAFKRRWEFEYIGIDDYEYEDGIEYVLGEKRDNKDYTVKVTWNNLRKAINRELIEYVNEDKLLGPYFIPKNLDPSNFKEVFENKVLMYLFEDIKASRNVIFDFDGKNNVLYSEIRKDFRTKGIYIFCENIRNEIIGGDDDQKEQ